MNKRNSTIHSFTIILLLSLTSLFAFAQGSLKCAECGKHITSEYFESSGKAYHSHCFVCFHCDKPIEGTYQSEKRHNYHPHCWKELFATRCDECNLPISKKYIESEGSTYHEDCYLNYIAPRCSICERPVMSAGLENWWGQLIHSEHKASSPRCSSCGKFVTGVYWQFEDDRVQCSGCESEKIDEVEKARKVTHRALDILARNGISIDLPLRKMTINLVDSRELTRLAGGSGDPHGLHRVEFETRNGKTIHEETTLYFLHSLPETVLLGVAAHELFHVWQHENSGDSLPDDWKEGSANVAMYLALRELNDPVARYHIEMMESSEDPEYGDGYRRAMKAFKKKGVKKFLDDLKGR